MYLILLKMKALILVVVSDTLFLLDIRLMSLDNMYYPSCFLNRWLTNISRERKIRN